LRRQAAVIAETLREGAAKQRRRQKKLKSRDSVLTRFSKSLIVPPAIRLLTSVRQQPDNKYCRLKGDAARDFACELRNLFARLTSQSPPEATGVLCPPGTRRFRAFLCADKSLCQLADRELRNRLLRARLFGRIPLRPLARPGCGIQQVGRGKHQGLSRLMRRDPPPVLHRRKAAAIRQVQECGPAIRIERQPIDDAGARGQSHKAVENRARTLRVCRPAN
jgi:hypothetical protein